MVTYLEHNMIFTFKAFNCQAVVLLVICRRDIVLRREPATGSVEAAENKVITLTSFISAMITRQV
jgi:hypothetical protein